MLRLPAFGEMLSREKFEMLLNREDFCFPMEMVDRGCGMAASYEAKTAVLDKLETVE